MLSTEEVPIYQRPCGLCGRHLQPTQINLTHQIYLCADQQCPYPLNTGCARSFLVPHAILARLHDDDDLTPPAPIHRREKSEDGERKTMSPDFLHVNDADAAPWSWSRSAAGAPAAGASDAPTTVTPRPHPIEVAPAPSASSALAALRRGNGKTSSVAQSRSMTNSVAPMGAPLPPASAPFGAYASHSSTTDHISHSSLSPSFSPPSVVHSSDFDSPSLRVLSPHLAGLHSHQQHPALPPHDQFHSASDSHIFLDTTALTDDASLPHHMEGYHLHQSMEQIEWE